MDERRSLSRAAGPSDAEAAMVMGNSTRTWDNYYDMRFQMRGAAAAVKAMPAWRQSLLSESDAIAVQETGNLNVDELD